MLNEYEIDRIAERTEEHAPEFHPFAKFLRDWKDAVNENSDGWPYWKAGSSCAKRLMSLLKQAEESIITRGEPPRVEDLRKALAPIRAMATRHGLMAPVLDESAAPSGPGLR